MFNLIQMNQDTFIIIIIIINFHAILLWVMQCRAIVWQ